MKDTTLIFRRAVSGDLHAVWSLLHAESFAWSEERIVANLNRLSLLTQNQKLIGVLLADVPESRKIEWIAIHPLYPEKPFRKLMSEGFHSLQTIGVFNTNILEAPVSAF